MTEVNGMLVAAHDLKAPLCLVRQLALALGDEHDENKRSQIEERIVVTSDRALRQVNDLAKIARLENGLFTMEPVSVRGVCDEVYKELGELYRFEKRELTLIYSNRNRLAVANRELLHSVIYNFCTNALHYASPNTEAALSVCDYKGKIRIGVRDFGPALPTKVWEEIRQGGIARPTNITMRPGSSGLGLYVASEFAKFMRSGIGAVRHRDGTSFYIDLTPSGQLTLW